MRPSDHTEIGGIGQAFLTTHWSLIEEVGQGDQDKDRALVGLLLGKYWKPVYCYLRRKGYDNEQAKDLTQGFFQEIVLGHDLIGKADSAKGRFRTFLLTALDRYLVNVRRAQTAQKRIPEHKLIHLDFANPPELPGIIDELSPEDSFTYAWVSSLLDRVLEEVKTACVQEGKAAHWAAFQDRVLQPAVEGTAAPSMREICQRHGIANPIKASNMIVTVKRRMQSILAEHLRQSVGTDEDAQEELREIKRFLPKLAQD
jgi:RNA polymerase sigma-70 factor (ECF subfamily)